MVKALLVAPPCTYSLVVPGDLAKAIAAVAVGAVPVGESVDQAPSALLEKSNWKLLFIGPELLPPNKKIALLLVASNVQAPSQRGAGLVPVGLN